MGARSIGGHGRTTYTIPAGVCNVTMRATATNKFSTLASQPPSVVGGESLVWTSVSRIGKHRRRSVRLDEKASGRKHEVFEREEWR
jgi:hypothetical protein